MPPEGTNDYRAILTEREREIISEEDDVSESYYYRVVSRIREKIERLDGDLTTLDENRPDLADEIRETVCNDD